MFSATRQRVLRGLDGFLHPRLRAGSEEDVWLSRLVATISLLSFIPLLRHLSLHYAGSAVLPAPAFATAVFMLAANLAVILMLRLWANLRAAKWTFQLLLSGIVSAVNLASAGAILGSILGSSLMVVSGMVLLGTRTGRWFALLSCVQIFGAFHLAEIGAEVPLLIDPDQLARSRPMTGLMSIATLTAFVWVHERLKERAMERFSEARDQALRLARAKSDFLASMSHEIRTPMNGVLGMSALLLESGLDDGQRRQAEMIHGSGEALLAILNDILDFS